MFFCEKGFKLQRSEWDSLGSDWKYEKFRNIVRHYWLKKSCGKWSLILLQFAQSELSQWNNSKFSGEFAQSQIDVNYKKFIWRKLKRGDFESRGTLSTSWWELFSHPEKYPLFFSFFLQWFSAFSSWYANLLSGTIPDSIGNLRNLTSL